MKKRLLSILFIIIISLFILPFFQNSGIAQDLHDTVRVECLEFVPAEATVTADVSIWNDETLCGFAIPLTFYNPPNTDIVCDSVVWSSTFMNLSPTVYEALIDSAQKKMILWWISMEIDEWPIGDHLVATLHFTTGPTWDESMPMRIDSTNWGPQPSVELSNCLGLPCSLEFIPGCYGEPVTASTHVTWGLILFILVVAGLLGYMIKRSKGIIRRV